MFAAATAVWSHWSWRSPDRPGPDWKTLVQADGNVAAATVREERGKACVQPPNVSAEEQKIMEPQ